MSNKAATGENDDFNFVMTCIQTSAEGFPKPDFEKVATVTGAKSANACYHRLWAIKNKWGMTGSRKNSAASSSGTTTPKTPRSTGTKRGRPAKVKAATPADPEEDSGDELVETPSKIRKTSNGKAKVKKEALVVEDEEGDTEELSNGENSEKAFSNGDMDGVKDE